MMKPKFDDVIEYVRAGEDDPELKKLLDLSPDGKELLKLARFICRMLERRFRRERDPGGSALAALSARSDQMVELQEFASESVGETFGFAKRRLLRHRFRREDREVVDLGTLELADEGEQVALSYAPSEQADGFISSFLVDSEPPKPILAGIHIRGATIQLALPESAPAGKLLTVHLSHGARQMPARGREVIFMPETGPFLKLRADQEGRIDFPVPESPGTLRIDTAITELLRIRLKK